MNFNSTRSVQSKFELKTCSIKNQKKGSDDRT